MQKKTLIGIIIVILIIVVFTIIIINKNDKNNEQDEEGTREEMTGEIENEEYYYKTESKYIELQDDLEQMRQNYIEKRLTAIQKNELNEYQEKMKQAVSNGKYEEKKKLSQEYINLVDEYLKKECTTSEIAKMNETQNEISKLEPVVNEYDELKMKVEKQKEEEDLETLADGRIKSNRKQIISDKKCEGMKFTNISLIYNPKEKATIFKAKVENETEKEKGETKRILKFEGDVSGEFTITIPALLSKESMEIEIPIYANITMANSLEIM